jgi:hypothetical protein
MTWWKTRIDAELEANVSALSFDALAELACAYNGFQRQAAVDELARRADPRAIAPLLVRTGDWVSQVSQAAQKGLVTLMRDEFIAQWAHALPELAFAYRIRRSDLRELIAAIEEFLVRNVDALEQHARSPDSAMRRWMFTLRLRQPHADAALVQILRQGLRSNELPTSQLCLQAAEQLREPALRREVLEAALHSRLPRVKTAAMRELLVAADGDAQLFIRTMCFDRSSAVRSLAVGALVAGRDEVADRAKEILSSSARDARRQVAALHVLSLLKDPQALVLARALVASPVVALRRLARWLVLSETEGNAVGAELLEILVDASPRVRRLAVEHVRRGAPLPNLDALMRLGLERRELARDVLAMLGCGSPWDRLLFVFELLEAGTLSGDLADGITNELHAWIKVMGNCYVQPQARQSARLASLWMKRAQLLPDERPKGLLPHGFPELTEYHLRAFHVI